MWSKNHIKQSENNGADEVQDHTVSWLNLQQLIHIRIFKTGG